MRKVIVLEDILPMIESRESFLRRSDFRVIPVTSNVEALALHNEERAHLIISRLDMPEMDGLEFCTAIRNNGELSRVSIIMVCNDSPGDARKRQLCKANAFVQLPADADSLIAKSQELLNIARREHYRVLLGVKVSGKFENLPFICRSINVSASGMLIESDKRLSSGDIIQCAFFLPDSRKIVAEAMIVRRMKQTSEYDTNQYGVRFIGISAEDQAAIEAFVHAQLA